MGISVLEYSGLSTAAGIGVVDKIANATGVTGAAQTVASGPTGALSNNNTLVLGLYSDSGFGVSVTKDATYTQRVNNTPSGISDLLVEDKLVNTGQTANATVTTGSNTHWLMATIALKPASADGPPPPPQVPGAPTGVSASAGNQSATVSWTAPGDGGSPITSYTVTPYIGATAQTAKTVTGSPPATTTTVTGLTNGTAYTFKVSATNTVGTGAQSTASNAVTPSAVIPPAFVQQTSAQQLSVSAATGLSAQPAANVQTGDRLIVQTEMWSSAGATAATVTDSAGNTYTKLLAYKAPDKTEMSIWTAPVTAGGGTRPTITVKPTGQTSMGISVLEYSGLSTAAGAGAVDKIANATGVTGAAQTVASGPTLAVANNNTLVLGLYSDSGFGVPVTKDATYTQRVNNTPSGISDLLVEDKLIDAGQTANATVTTGANTHWLMATIAFKPAGAAFSAAKRASRAKG
jgi:Fibronectin type III domain